MTKTILYLSSLAVLGGSSAWLGQRWRLEGAVQEASKLTEGGILLQRLQADAEAEAQMIFAVKERDGRIEGAAITAAGEIAGRKLALEGEEIQTRTLMSGELATSEYYLEPVFGSDKAIRELTEKLNKTPHGEERENLTVALKVLVAAKEQTRATMDYVRVQMARRAGDLYRETRDRCSGVRR